jgi:dTMP kinase
LRPDLTLLLDLPVEVGLERAGKRSQPDRFETEDMRFFQAVRKTYLAIAEAEPGRVRIIDAAPSLGEVQARIEGVLGEFLGNG